MLLSLLLDVVESCIDLFSNTSSIVRDSTSSFTLQPGTYKILIYLGSVAIISPVRAIFKFNLQSVEATPVIYQLAEYILPEGPYQTMLHHVMTLTTPKSIGLFCEGGTSGQTYAVDESVAIFSIEKIG